MSFADLINIENCIFESNCFSKKSFLVFNKKFKHCTENQILFFQTSWKDGLSKKIVMKYDLSCIIGKNDISFFRKYDLTLRRKMKDDLCQKKYTEIWYFLQMFWKDGLFKRDYYAGVWSLLYYLERWYFFPKTWYFFLGQEARDDLSQEIHGNMIFPVYTYGCYKRGVTPLCQKKSKMVLSRKRDLKVVDVLDWHPRKGSSNSLYFHGDLYERFHVFLSCEKTENSIYRSEVWLLLQFIRLEIFYNE